MSSRLFLLLACLGVASRAAAQDVPEAVIEVSAAPEEAQPIAPPPQPASPFTLDIGPLPVEFHGYATQGYVLSDHNNYLAYNSNKGSFAITEVALNAASQVTDRLRFVLQIASVITDETASGPTVRLDFGFVDYRWFDALGFRIGRFRMLGNLYTEVWDTDIARVPIFLPQSVYDPLGRLMFMNCNGAQIYGALRSQHAGSVDYALSVGTLLPFVYNDFNVQPRLVYTGRLIYATPFSGLRVGASGTGFTGTTILPSSIEQGLMASGALPSSFQGDITETISGFWRASVFAELSLGNWQLAAEYMRMHSQRTVDNPLAALAIPTTTHRPDGGYVMTNYRFTDWFTAGAYASLEWEDYAHRGAGGAAMHTYDYAATLRFDINAYLALKTEMHRIYGTSGLNPDLNPGQPASAGWMFAARVSAAF